MLRFYGMWCGAGVCAVREASSHAGALGCLLPRQTPGDSVKYTCDSKGYLRHNAFPHMAVSGGVAYTLIKPFHTVRSARPSRSCAGCPGMA
jgi:hypothetical protein